MEILMEIIMENKVSINRNENCMVFKEKIWKISNLGFRDNIVNPSSLKLKPCIGGKSENSLYLAVRGL